MLDYCKKYSELNRIPLVPMMPGRMEMEMQQSTILLAYGSRSRKSDVRSLD
jgi:hypothetical protein